MVQAVPAKAMGHFEERQLPAPLRDVFACVWIHRMPEGGTAPVIVSPDATIDLQWIDGAFRVAGPDREPQTELLRKGATVIGLRFRPAAAAGWLGVPAVELLGQRLALDDLWGARGRRLADEVLPDARLSNLLGALESAIGEVEPRVTLDRAMQAAFEIIERGPPPGAPLVPWLMRALAMSERTLRRRFDESFGYGPKTLDRILRYQRFLRLSREADAPTAALAAEAGYADQAHLVRESRRLTGRTPRQIQLTDLAA